MQRPSRPRRILLVEGAPGFEHSFLKRAWAGDQGLEVDAVVRKGKDERGANTFYVQAAHSRGDALVSGYPQTVEALSAYDAIVLANVDAAMLTGAAARGDAHVRVPARRRPSRAWLHVVRAAGIARNAQSKTRCRSS